MAKSSKQLKLKCNKFARKRNKDNIPRKQTKITDYLNASPDTEFTVELAEKNCHVGNIKFMQINNQKRIMSTEETSRLASQLNSFCVLGQEPSTFGFNITGLSRNHKVIQASVDKPRAYIYHHKGLDVWPVEELTTRDTACAIINSKTSKNLLVLSIYWDGRIKTSPKKYPRPLLWREKKITSLSLVAI